MGAMTLQACPEIADQRSDPLAMQRISAQPENQIL